MIFSKNKLKIQYNLKLNENIRKRFDFIIPKLIYNLPITVTVIQIDKVNGEQMYEFNILNSVRNYDIHISIKFQKTV